MPRKKKPSQLTPSLLARFDALLWTHTEAFAREFGLPYEELSETDYAEEYDTHRRQLHATLSALERRGTDLEQVWYALLVARYSEVFCLRQWKALDAEQTRQQILKQVPRSREWRWLRTLLAPSALVRWGSTRDRRGPLGKPWLTTAEAELKALGVPLRYCEGLLQAVRLKPFTIA